MKVEVSVSDNYPKRFLCIFSTCMGMPLYFQPVYREKQPLRIPVYVPGQ